MVLTIRVAETTNTTGHANFMLTGAHPPHDSFAAAATSGEITAGTNFDYLYVDGSDFEIGVGAYDDTLNVIERLEVKLTSINGSRNTSGTKISASGAGIISILPTYQNDHNHDSDYATSDHNHDSDYAASDHKHDSDYAASNHNHDSDYAASGHNHDSDYATSDHNHDSDYAPINNPSFTGTVTCGSNAIGKQFEQGVNVVGNVSANNDIDYSLGQVHSLTMTATAALTFKNPPASGTLGYLHILVAGGDTHAPDFTTNNTIKWAGGTAPTPSSLDLWFFETFDGGSSWIGSAREYS